MLRLRKGCKVPFPFRLSEGYQYEAPYYTANVNANKIRALLQHFIEAHNEPLFFIFEIPTNKNNETEVRSGVVTSFHKDVYYIDGCSKEKALSVLNIASDIMINDGMCSFGFGCHYSHDEIMIGKYNVVHIFSPNGKDYDDFFASHKIRYVQKLLTAWDTFSHNHHGETRRIITKGKSIYDIPEMLKDLGLYLAEQRED